MKTNIVAGIIIIIIFDTVSVDLKLKILLLSKLIVYSVGTILELLSILPLTLELVLLNRITIFNEPTI